MLSGYSDPSPTTLYAVSSVLVSIEVVFQMSKAMAMQSKPGPMFADVADVFIVISLKISNDPWNWFWNG